MSYGRIDSAPGKGPGPIKVCYVIDSLSGGGAETQLALLVKNIDRDRITPTVCCLTALEPVSRPAEEMQAPITFFQMDNLFTGTGLREWLRFTRFLRQNQFDVVHTYLFTADIAGLLGSFFARTGIRISSRRDLGFWRKPHHRWFYRYILNPITHHFIPNAAETAKQLIAGEKVLAANITTIVNGIDTEKFNSATGDSEAVHRLLQLPEGAYPVLGIVASLTAVKGHSHLLEAMQTVLKRYPGASLLIIGSGPLKENLRMYAAELGITSAVKFLGYQSGVHRIYPQLDLLVSASLSEATSNTILEGMACELPVVATRVGANPQLILSGENGYLCEPGSSASLAEQLLVALDDLGEGKNVGPAARLTVTRNYSIPGLVLKTADLYERLLGARAACE